MASVSKRKRTKADGTNGDKWIVRYVDRGGNQRQQTFDKKRDADACRAKVETELSRGIHAHQAKELTVGDVAKALIERMNERVRAGQIGREHAYRVDLMLTRHVLPHLGAVKLEAVDLSMLERWHRDMKAARGLSARYSQHVAQTLKMVFDHALKREWTYRNPVALLLKEIGGAKHGEIETFSVDQIRALLQAAGAKSYQGRRPDAALRLQCAVHLATFCGLRIGEIVGLRAEHVDFDAGVLRVRHSVSRRDGLKGPKSAAGVRDVAMPAHVAVLLQAWLDRHQVPANRGNPLGLLFTYPSGKPFDQDSFRAGSWGPLLHRAGLAPEARKPTFHFHALRHFAASWMIENQWSLPEVAGALGHSKVDMTMSVYAHALRNRAANGDQMQALSDRLLEAPRIIKSAQIAHDVPMSLINKVSI